MTQGKYTGCTKTLIMFAFLVGGLSIVATGLLGAIWSRSYPFHSDPCDGNIGSSTKVPDGALTCQGDGSATNPGIIVSRGYKSTSALIDANLLPSDFADANKHLCLWDTTHEVCAETAGTNKECDDAKDSNGQLKDRNGPNDKCLQTRVPEVCKQTGFRDATDPGETQSVVEKLADAGHNVEVAFILFLVVSVLGTSSLINIAFRLEYGYVKGLTFVCGWLTSIRFLKKIPFNCFKKNKVDIDEKGGRFHNDHEAFSIWLVLLIHEALLIVFGRMAIDAQELIQKECYGVTGTPYGTDNALKMIQDLTNKDAHAREHQGNNFYIAFVVLWWVTVIAAAVKTIGMACAVENSSDMDIAIPMASEIIPDMLKCNCDGNENKGSYGTGMERKEMMSRRVQLRGQF